MKAQKNGTSHRDLTEQLDKLHRSSQWSTRPAQGCPRYPMCPIWGSWTPTLLLTGRDVAGPCITEPRQWRWKTCCWMLLDHCHDRWWWLICLVLWISLALFLPQLLSLLLFHVISMFKQWNKTMQPLLLGPHLSFILRPTFEAMEATNQEANPDRSVYRYLKRKTVRRSISDYKCVKCGKCAKNTLNLG